MRIFITEFKVGEETYDGPPIRAETFEEAETQAQLFDLVVVGGLDAIVVAERGYEYKKRVLH